jgi:hypothetical protein
MPQLAVRIDHRPGKHRELQLRGAFDRDPGAPKLGPAVDAGRRETHASRHLARFPDDDANALARRNLRYPRARHFRLELHFTIDGDAVQRLDIHRRRRLADDRGRAQHRAGRGDLSATVSVFASTPGRAGEVRATCTSVWSTPILSPSAASTSVTLSPGASCTTASRRATRKPVTGIEDEKHDLMAFSTVTCAAGCASETCAAASSHDRRPSPAKWP